MNLPPQSAQTVTEALGWVVDAALDINPTGSPEDIRRALLKTRDAILYAAETLTDAERETRNAALAKLENAA